MIRRYGQNYTLKFLTGIIEPQIPLTETGLKVRYHFTKFAGWDWVLTAKSVPTKKKNKKKNLHWKKGWKDDKYFWKA